MSEKGNPLNDPGPPEDDPYNDPDPDDNALCEHGKIMDECRWCDAEMNCGLGPDGQCGNAGSEYCDFECPNRDSEFFAGSAAWRKKHAKKSTTP